MRCSKEVLPLPEAAQFFERSGPTAVPSCHRLRQGVVGGGVRDSAANLLIRCQAQFVFPLRLFALGKVARIVCCVDSRVVLGAVSKGRSSSRRLNRRLAFECLSASLSIDSVWVPSWGWPSQAPTLHFESAAVARELKLLRGPLPSEKRLICYWSGGKGHPGRLCPSGDDCQDVDEVGTEPSSDADSDLFGLDWGDDSIATINSVTERNDRTRGGKELLAFVGLYRVLPGGDFQVAEQSWCKRSKRMWAATVSSQDKRWKQDEHHLGSRGCAQPVPPVVCSREVTSLYWTRSRGSSARVETQFRTRGPVVCSPYGCGFRRFFTGRAEHEPHQEKRACKTTH